jgi:hypothetical protein
VPRSESEALKRFGDYTELHDGTLMRVEGDMEFRIYCEDVEGCPLGVVTEGVLSMFSELHDDVHPREAAEAREQSESPRTMYSHAAGQVRVGPTSVYKLRESPIYFGGRRCRQGRMGQILADDRAQIMVCRHEYRLTRLKPYGNGVPLGQGGTHPARFTIRT